MSLFSYDIFISWYLYYYIVLYCCYGKLHLLNVIVFSVAKLLCFKYILLLFSAYAYLFVVENGSLRWRNVLHSCIFEPYSERFNYLVCTSSTTILQFNSKISHYGLLEIQYIWGLEENLIIHLQPLPWRGDKHLILL
jgi:hypothetical protein